MEEVSFESVINERGYLCWTNVGVSMMPLLRQGKDIMIIRQKPAEGLKKYDIVLFRRPGIVGRGEYVLHRIMRCNGDSTYWIVGDNCSCGETVKEENILGILTGIQRNGKLIDFNSSKYRAYMRFWITPYPIRLPILALRNFIRYWGHNVKNVLRKLKLIK